MKRIYLSGQRTFDNRGCEAIVRSTVQLVQEHFKTAEVIVPSDDPGRDRIQWPESGENGATFAHGYFPIFARYWINLQRLPIPMLKNAGWPFPIPSKFRRLLAATDAILAIGGDNYSLDYKIPSLIMSIDGLCMNLQKPVILWGASVGPFEAEPDFVPFVRDHLDRMALIVVRESVSEAYLRENLKLKNVVLGADPAFLLIPQPVELSSFWPDESGDGVLGINISPVVARYRTTGRDLREDVCDFISRVLMTTKLSILLVPHVVPLNGSGRNNDTAYMQPVLDRLGSWRSRIGIMDATFNAPQTKYVISRCRYFIGARTHATIAAFSSMVPTISIAYSIKAKGINQDLLGNCDYVLETPGVNAASLWESLEKLMHREMDYRSILHSRMIDLIKRVQSTFSLVAETIG